jgi:hypothetical protein
MNLDYFSNWKNEQKVMFCEITDEVQTILGTLTTSRKDFCCMTYTYISIPDRNDLDKTHYYFIFLPFITGIERQQKEATENGSYAHNYNYSFGIYPENNRNIFIKDSKLVVPKQLYEKFFNQTNEYMIMKYNYSNKKLEFPEYVFVGQDPPALVKIDTLPIESSSVLDSEWFLNKQVRSKFNLILEFTQPKLTPWDPPNIRLELSNGKTFFKFISET